MRRDLAALKARGAADDILQATCAKLLARAKDSLTRHDTSSDFATRYLEMTRNSLVTAYRQVRARVTRLAGGVGGDAGSVSASFGARDRVSLRL